MKKLEKEINRMRDNLILIAKEGGLTSEETVSYSQELDKLIIKYQRLAKGDNENDLHTSSREKLFQ